MDHVNGWMLLSVAALYALPVIALPAGIIGSVQIRAARRTGSTARRTVGVLLAGVAAADVLGALPSLVGLIIDDAKQAAARGQVEQVAAPREVGGIMVPAGSQVRVAGQPPRVISGTLSGPTRIGGLVITGPFIMNDGAPETGTLAEPQTVGPLACAAAEFKRDGNQVSCTLARDVPFEGLTLQGGKWITVTPGAQGRHGWVEGTLAAPGKMFGLLCAAGVVYFGPWLSECRLAADGAFDGYTLKAGTVAAIVTTSEQKHHLSRGVLGAPLDIRGVVLPVGTMLKELPALPGDALRGGTGLSKYRSAKVETPPGSATAVHGGEVQGSMSLDFTDEGVGVAPGEGNGVFAMGDRRAARAAFDVKEGVWRFPP